MRSSKNLKVTVKPVSLAEHTTLRIGGAAKLFYRPKNLRALLEAVDLCRARKVKPRVLGSGSNILASDKGVDFPVIKLDAAAFGGIKNDGNFVGAGAGCTLARLLVYCRDKGLSGPEFLAGIPGTVGGALAGNAGISQGGRQWAIGDLVESVTVLDYNNNLKLLSGKALRFSYRRSNLSGYIILSVRLKVSPAGQSAVRRNIADYLSLRRSQDRSFPNAGCVFKNPSGGRSAGALIDGCGLKGKKIGSAMISAKHANFFLNTGGASCEEVLALMKLAKGEVKKKYKVTMEPEIKIWR